MNVSWEDIALVMVCAGLAAFPRGARAEDSAPGLKGTEAVASKVSPDYIRAKMPDGSFKPEFYSFGKGGFWGSEIDDKTIDSLSFMDVAHAIAPALSSQKYVPATDPKATRLLIMVYWGTTTVPPPYEMDSLYRGYHAAAEEYRLLLSEIPPAVDEANAVLSSGLHMLEMENHIRDRTDFKNAAMLGYDMSGLVGTDWGNYLSHTAAKTERNDEVEELEENRYFVVLMAYDFQLLWKEKKHKLLWEARFSINEKHNEFDKALPAMASYASRYFGQPSHKLIRRRLLQDNVEIGEPTLIQFLTEPKK
jgi:hypothetical protein